MLREGMLGLKEIKGLVASPSVKDSLPSVMPRKMENDGLLTLGVLSLT